MLIPQVLDQATIRQWREILYGLYDRGAYEISNSVGNVAFEKLVALEPTLSRQLLGHPAATPYLKE